MCHVPLAPGKLTGQDLAGSWHAPAWTGGAQGASGKKCAEQPRCVTCPGPRKCLLPRSWQEAGRHLLGLVVHKAQQVGVAQGCHGCVTCPGPKQHLLPRSWQEASTPFCGAQCRRLEPHKAATVCHMLQRQSLQKSFLQARSWQEAGRHLLGLVVHKAQQVGVAQGCHCGAPICQQGHILDCGGVLPGPHSLTGLCIACWRAGAEPGACMVRRVLAAADKTRCQAWSRWPGWRHA